jgi:hypothetical protein
MNDFSEVFGCDYGRVKEWTKTLSDTKNQTRDFRNLCYRNQRSHWNAYANDAIQLVAHAFHDIHLPVIIGPEAFLGWYQSCSTPIQGEKLDFIVLAELVRSKQQFDLLQVCFLLL